MLLYQREEYRPKNWIKLFNWTRDTGPRLLRYDLDPRPDPISRFYPDLPTVGLDVGSSYIRDRDAPGDIPDVVLEQFCFDVWDQEEKGPNSRVYVHRDMAKGDGTWVYIKAPEEITSPENLSREEFIKGIIALGVVGEDDIETLQIHSLKGWMVRLRSKKLAWSIRSSRVVIYGFNTYVTLCKPEGVQIFFCRDYGSETIWGYLIQGLLEMKEIRNSGTRFWVGAHNEARAGKHRALLIFESPVNFSEFDVRIPGPVSFLASFVGGRESDKKSMEVFMTEKCSICFQAHPERPIQHCPRLNTLWTGGLKGSELLLPEPPSYFYFR